MNNVTAAEQRKQDIAESRYRTKYRISTAIIYAIAMCEPYTSLEALNIFNEWRKEEDGDLALTRLVNMIIY